jgi:hypothetical protein
METIVERPVRVRRFGIAALVAAIATTVGMGLAPGPASAVTAITAHGSVNCVASGKVKYGPKLRPAPQATVARIKATLTCAIGQTGNAAVTVASGKLKGASEPFLGSCAFPGPEALTSTIKWKATGGKVAPTTIRWTGVSTGASAAGYSHTLEDATVTGSYAAQASELKLASGSSSAPAACVATPLKGWSFALGSLRLSVGGGGGSEGGGGGTKDGGGSDCGPIATTSDGAVGSNGNVWQVIVPAEFPACASHPTGSMSYFVNTLRCLSPSWSGPLSDSGAVASQQFGPFPTTLWGIDLGITPEEAAQLNEACMPVSGGISYSGDTMYSPI